MLLLLALMGAVLLFFLAIIWPVTSLAVGMVGQVLVSLIIIFLGREGGVTYFIFGLQLLGITVYLFRSGVWPFRFTKIEYWTFAFVGIMLVSLFFTSAPLYGREKTLRFIGTCLILMVAARYFIRDEVALRKSLKVLGWFSVITVALYLILFVVFRGQLMEGGRFGGKEGSLIMGWSSAAAAVLMLYLVIGKTRLATKIIASGGVLLAMVMVVASGSRGPFVALVFGVVLAFFSVRSMLPSLAGIILVGLVGYLALHYLAPEQGRERISQGFGGEAFEESGRPYLYRIGISLFLSRPVLGGGTGSYAPYVGQGDQRGYPHNMIIEVASEMGVIGLILMGLIFWGCFKSIMLLRFSLRELSVEGKILQYLFWVGLANSMLSFDLPDQRILFGAIGLLAAVPNLYKQSKEYQLYDELSYGNSLEPSEEYHYEEVFYG